LGAQQKNDGFEMTKAAVKRNKLSLFPGVFGGFLLLFLALLGASWSTTRMRWNGSFPGGEYRLIVKNQMGEAIEDAALWVYSDRADFPMQAYEYPIDNFYFNERLASNAQGLIIAYHIPLYPVEFEATCWKPFWVFKYCKDIPKYWFLIDAEGYKPTKFSSNILFEMEDAGRNGVATTSVNYYDHTFELPVYERIIILENN
jgi:hypothetical protein